ncbi:DUF167 domain-containing protein [Ideonella sp. 4Y16]|uniref:UPF0235 protein KAK03_22255 n=1 Tax=Ideonella alba TaxID=2824118 RepID=A0A940YAZ6_9BURK|nr:DUF167 domain-containing protein [Ideonella alba]MBQ0933204.1 DUF167 domain-containing protein [Ideonella alba]MBQ0944675.1 DUF167 domain-containing protein [Ideonella alba]
MSPDPWPCARADGATRCLLDASVVPNAKKTEAVGLHDGALRVRLAAPPVDGKANDTLVAWVAAELGLPRRAVRLKRGPASRSKQLEIDLPLTDVQAWLVRCLGSA